MKPWLITAYVIGAAALVVTYVWAVGKLWQVLIGG